VEDDDEFWDFDPPSPIVDYAPPEPIGWIWLPDETCVEVMPERPPFGFARGNG
jgi:hypothetical protein